MRQPIDKCAGGVKLPKHGPCPECGAGPDRECPRSRIAEAEELKRLRDFRDWVETWVSNPVGSYSVMALDGLFGMTRDKIAATRITD